MIVWTQSNHWHYFRSRLAQVRKSCLDAQLTFVKVLAKKTQTVVGFITACCKCYKILLGQPSCQPLLDSVLIYCVSPLLLSGFINGLLLGRFSPVPRIETFPISASFNSIERCWSLIFYFPASLSVSIRVVNNLEHVWHNRFRFRAMPISKRFYQVCFERDAPDKAHDEIRPERSPMSHCVIRFIRAIVRFYQISLANSSWFKVFSF